jgi:hypothetical protein
MAAFIHTLPHYDQKLRRSLYDAMYNNPNKNEAPYYEVWDLWINDLILPEMDYSCHPQGVLSVVAGPGCSTRIQQKPKKAKRSPNFIIYHNTDSEGKHDSDYRLKREVAFIAEVKPWQMAMGEDVNLLEKEFEDPEFLEQVRDHAKMILTEHPAKARVWLLQCLGLFWRAGTLRNENLSPFSNRPHAGKKKVLDHGTVMEWWPIQRVDHVNSNVQQLDFWRWMSDDVSLG